MRFTIITPEKTILDTETNGVFVRAIDGELGILPNHIPLMTALDIGVATYIKQDGTKDYVSVLGGIFKVENNEVTILTKAAELSEDIDEIKAKEAADRAKAELQRAIDTSGDKYSAEVEKARLAFMKAMSRLKTARKN
ncbi:MAG: ATP synthase F1 subunit epsilon [Vampirovibrionia bacterium]